MGIKSYLHVQYMAINTSPVQYCTIMKCDLSQYNTLTLGSKERKIQGESGDTGTR